jgi:hypothetical protein
MKHTHTTNTIGVRLGRHSAKGARRQNRRHQPARRLLRPRPDCREAWEAHHRRGARALMGGRRNRPSPASLRGAPTAALRRSRLGEWVLVVEWGPLRVDRRTLHPAARGLPLRWTALGVFRRVLLPRARILSSDWRHRPACAVPPVSAGGILRAPPPAGVPVHDAP